MKLSFILFIFFFYTAILSSQKINLDSTFGTNGIVHFNTDYGFGYLEINSNNEPVILNTSSLGIKDNSISFLDIYGALKTNLVNNPTVLKPPIDIFGEYPRMDIDSENNIYYLRYMTGKNKNKYVQIIKIFDNSMIDTLNNGIGIFKECFSFSLQEFKRLYNGNYILSGNNESNSIIVKINNLGEIDSTFHNNFINSIQILNTDNYPVQAIESDEDNIFGVLHLKNSISLIKLKYNGLIDSNFGSNGIVNLFYFNQAIRQQYQVRDIKLLHDSSIIVSFSNELVPKSTYIYKVTKNGLLDNNFGVNGLIFNYNYSSIQNTTLDKDDNIYTNISYPNGNKIVKYSKNGNIDIEFEKLNPELYNINIDKIIYSEPSTIYTIGTNLETITLSKFEIKVIVNIIDTHVNQSVNIFPNPVNSNITITNTNINSSVNIFDNLGRKQNIDILDMFGNSKIIDVKYLVKGIYFLEYIDKNNFHKVFKVIKAN
jgi:hypothetical protein